MELTVCPYWSLGVGKTLRDTEGELEVVMVVSKAVGEMEEVTEGDVETE